VKTGDAASLLTAVAEQMQRAVDWLRLSYEKCRPWMDAAEFSIDQAEAAEALRPRSQTPFGNAIAGETLFRWRAAGRVRTRPLGNRVAQTSPFPNRVWERGNRVEES
jgi:hypothetical protein